MSRARRAVLLVASRELRERTNSRAFLLATIAIMAIVVAGVVIPGLREKTTRLRAGTTGPSRPGLVVALHQAAGADGARLDVRQYASVAAGEAAARDGRVGVLIVAGHRLVWKAEPDTRLAAVVSAAVQRVRLAERAAALGLSPAQATALMRTAPLPARQLEPARRDREARDTIAFVGFIVLLTVLIWYGSAVAEGVAQEKGGRIMEVLLSRARASELLAGKVLGIGLIGLVQVALAGLAGAVAIVAFETVDVPGAVPLALASTVLWFVLGYAFWSVAFAAVGALVSRVEDLQSAVAPMTWTMMLSAFVAPVAAQDPDAWYVRVASLFPTTAPFVMPARVAVAHVGAWEVALAATIMLAATYGLVRLAAAVYSGALLRTGARPRWRDVLRAARAA